MTLSAGQSLSHYEILGTLGAGAMGQVYRARDTRLEREVALKVLPEELAADAEGLHRFEREAKALAALSHPNVAQVFGIDRAGDTSFIAMELVRGEDLSARLERGPLSPTAAMDVARQIAAGLEAAHEAGVIHRDLKPANVVVNPDDEVKVLDFGLAKSVGASGGAWTTDSVHSTAEGRLLGTPTYMAPEQARGRPIDKRVDVWAFGCVLYECLAGRRAFEGTTLSDVLAAVLEKEPDWSALPRGVHPRLRELLERCLRKDPRQRLRDVGDARILLGELQAGLLAEESAAGAHPPVRAWAAFGLVLVVLAFLFLDPWRSSSARPASYKRAPLTATSGLVVDLNWSPSGEFIAFGRHVAGSIDVFMKRVPDGSLTALVEGPGDDHVPRWSPDGDRLAFVSTLEPGTPVYVLRPFSGGAVEKLIETNIPALRVDSVTMAMGDRPWAPDQESILVARVTETGQRAIFRVSIDDRAAVQLTHPPAGAQDGSASYTHAGDRIVFARSSLEGASFHVMSETGEDQRVLLQDEFQNHYPTWRHGDRRIVFMSNRSGADDLWELDLDTRGLRPVTSETKGVYGVTVSNDDRIAYSSFWHDTFLTWLDPETGETKRLTDHAGSNGWPRFSPDDSCLVYGTNRGGDNDLWLRYFDERSEERITFDREDDWGGDWSPDGRRMVFFSSRRGAAEPFVWSANDGSQRPLLDGPVKFAIEGTGTTSTETLRWSPDDALIAFIVSEPSGPALWAVRPDGTNARRLVEGVLDFDWYLTSRTVVYTSSAGIADELWVQDLDSGKKALLWRGKHDELDVAPDGHAVIFCSGEGHHGMGLARLALDPPGGPDELPTARDPEPEMLVEARSSWHVHRPNWSSDAKSIVYVYDQDYSDVAELVEQP